MSPKTRVPRPAAESTAPPMSRDLLVEPSRLSGTAHHASATTIMPKGMFIQNAQRHVAFVRSQPPTSGPIAAMPPIVDPHTANAMARSLPTKIALRLESVAGSRNAAPMPWRSLAAMSVAPEPAAPARMGFGDVEGGVKPTLFIHKRCGRVIETLPALQHDPNRPEDVLKVDCDEDGIGGDDCADALRYLVATKSPTVTQRKLRGF